MDDFREWLSDNLRYILLGLAIIAVLLVLFFGIRFLTSTFGDDSKKEQKVTEQQKDTEKEQKEIEEKIEFATASDSVKNCMKIWPPMSI